MEPFESGSLLTMESKFPSIMDLCMVMNMVNLHCMMLHLEKGSVFFPGKKDHRQNGYVK
jgi:hypothetical protein